MEGRTEEEEGRRMRWEGNKQGRKLENGERKKGIDLRN